MATDDTPAAHPVDRSHLAEPPDSGPAHAESTQNSPPRRQVPGPRRRVFVVVREVPQLQWDLLMGRPRALRRVLGARRSGRLGAMLLLAAFLAAVAPRHMSLVGTIHILISAVVGHLTARPQGLGPVQHQRLLCWFVAPMWLCAAPFRLFLDATWIAGILGELLGQLLLAKYLLEPRPFGALVTDDSAPQGTRSEDTSLA